MFKLDDVLASEMGIYFKRGALINELLKLPEPKDGYSYDWGNEHGVEYDNTSTIKYKPLQYDVTVYLCADTISGLLDVRSNLLNIITKKEGFSLWVDAFEREFKLRYKGSGGAKLISPLFTSAKHWCEINLKLENNFEPVSVLLYLADMDGDLATTSDDEYIMVTGVKRLF